VKSNIIKNSTNNANFAASISRVKENFYSASKTMALTHLVSIHYLIIQKMGEGEHLVGNTRRWQFSELQGSWQLITYLSIPITFL